jgi:hypothetical protein
VIISAAVETHAAVEEGEKVVVPMHAVRLYESGPSGKRRQGNPGGALRR